MHWNRQTVPLLNGSYEQAKRHSIRRLYVHRSCNQQNFDQSTGYWYHCINSSFFENLSARHYDISIYFSSISVVQTPWRNNMPCACTDFFTDSYLVFFYFKMLIENMERKVAWTTLIGFQYSLSRIFVLIHLFFIDFDLDR